MAEFNDFDVDDFDFDDIKESSPQPNKRKQDEAGLGINEEVSVAKRPRAMRIKLDEAKLLSDKGIPRLRQRARTLNFKGKGHEFRDAALLLEFYQDWLDDLFPKAKFLDALAMVEKLGHKNTMRKQRMDWINEGKPRDMYDLDDCAPAPDNRDTTPEEAARLAPIFKMKKEGEKPKTPDGLFGGDAAVIDLTPRVERTTLEERSVPMMSGALGDGTLGDASGSIFSLEPAKSPAPKPGTNANESESRGNVGLDDDDLDALMAEVEADSRLMTTSEKHSSPRLQNPSEKDFADEEAAMAEMDGLW